jgi:hypothetical protein
LIEDLQVNINNLNQELGKTKDDSTLSINKLNEDLKKASEKQLEADSKLQILVC